jgi:DNA-binding IclR family transcriptional regulator
MSSLTQMLAVLDVFSTDRPTWRPEDVAERLGYTRTTAYRYVKELIAAGLLQKVAAGSYALGPRIVELDCLMRRSDPVLLASAPIMDKLVKVSGLDSVLSSMAGGKIVDTHRASSQTGLSLKFGRGRPRPLFLGSAAKILLAHQPRADLVRIYDAHKAEIAQLGLGANWPAFRTYMAQLREQGFYQAFEELEQGLGGASVPVHAEPQGPVVAALALVGPVARIRKVGDKQLRQWLTRAASEVTSQLGQREPT